MSSKPQLARQQGRGIDLPYVRAISASHDGSLEMDSNAEQSTVVPGPSAPPPKRVL